MALWTYAITTLWEAQKYELVQMLTFWEKWASLWDYGSYLISANDHAWFQKVLSEGVQLWQLFFSWWGERGSAYHYKRTTIGTPTKCHLNGVSLECRWGPNIECWLSSFVIRSFMGSEPVLLRNPIFFWCFKGWGVRTPCPSPLDPPMNAFSKSQRPCLQQSWRYNIQFEFSCTRNKISNWSTPLLSQLLQKVWDITWTFCINNCKAPIFRMSLCYI